MTVHFTNDLFEWILTKIVENRFVEDSCRKGEGGVNKFDTLDTTWRLVIGGKHTIIGIRVMTESALTQKKRGVGPTTKTIKLSLH
jgi:hypothetical protein